MRSIPALAGEPRQVIPRWTNGLGTLVGLPTRSIPALAGEPEAIRRPRMRINGGVYPRVGGGTALAGPHRDVSNAWGLSPRWRGNP